MEDSDLLLHRIRYYSRTNTCADGAMRDMVEKGDTEAMHHITYKFLESVFGTYTSLEMLEFLRLEVFGNCFRTAFWNESPLERVTATLIYNIDEFGIRILQESALNGADAVRMACNVHLWIKRHIFSVSESELVLFCELMSILAKNKKAVDCLMNVQLFRDMSERCRYSDRIMESVLGVFLDANVTEFSYSFLMAEMAAMSLIKHFSNVKDIHFHSHLLYSLRFLERLAALMEWHVFISEWIVSLSKHKWPLVFGKLVSNMLSTPSVVFIVDLHRAHRLDSLILASHNLAVKNQDWMRVCRRLRSQWPSRFAKVLDFQDETCSSTMYECPITLQKCISPVVASDGHTYERDALFKVLTTDPISPITKSRLSYILFDNYAIRQ